VTTISAVCQNLFSQTNLKDLPYKPDRGSRRNLARIVYRQGRRPGLVNPLSASELPPRLPRSRGRTSQCVQRPMRHVYKLHEPQLGKLRMTDVVNLPLRA
jgi:hypothetical protein